MRGADDANIGVSRFARADRRIGALLQKAKQLHLHGQWRLADFVEEQRPAARGGDQAGGVGVRATLDVERVMNAVRTPLQLQSQK